MTDPVSDASPDVARFLAHDGPLSRDMAVTILDRAARLMETADFADAGRLYSVMKITVPAPREKTSPDTFHFRLDRARLRAVRRRTPPLSVEELHPPTRIERHESRRGRPDARFELSDEPQEPPGKHGAASIDPFAD